VCSPCQYDVDLWFTKSTDEGATWTEPKIISESDGPPYDQFFPWIEVDAAGRIHLVYYDTGASTHTDQENVARLQSRYAYSLDGGDHWVHQTISPSWSGMPPPPTWTDGQSLTTGFIIGDYLGLAASAQRVYPLYMATRGPDNPDASQPDENVYTNIITWQP